MTKNRNSNHVNEKSNDLFNEMVINLPNRFYVNILIVNFTNYT